METKIDTLLKLSTNVITHIILFLTTKDILILSRVSKDIKRNFREANYHINHFIVVRNFHRPLESFLISSFRIMISNLFKMFPKIDKLKFQCTKKMLFDLEATMPRSTQPFICRYLDFYEYKCNYFGEIALNEFYESKQLLKNLTELSIPIHSDFELKSLRNFENLTKLEILYSAISNDNLLSVIKKLNKLQSLTLLECLSITQDFFIDINLKNLTELNLSNCQFIRSLFNFKSFQRLTSLNLLKTNVICFNEIDKLKDLVSLTLGDNDGDLLSINNQALFEISKLSSLRTLVIHDERNITITGFSYLIRMTNLTSLDCFGSYSIFRNHLYDHNINLNLLRNFTNLTYLDIYLDISYFETNEDEIECTSLEFLATMVKLKYFDMSDSFGILSEMIIGQFPFTVKNVNTLVLSKCIENISEAGFQVLALLTNLKTLDLCGSTISAAGVSHLSSLLSLNRLNLSTCHLQSPTDIINLNFSQLLSLNSLSVGFIKLCDEQLATIACLKNLTELDISGSCITDTGIGYLSSLINLKTLLLYSNGGITNDGLCTLSSLKSLNKLLVSFEYYYEIGRTRRNANITVKKLSELQSVNFNWTIEILEGLYNSTI
jgi:hypothetical protein